MSHELKTKVSLKQENEMIYKCNLGGIKIHNLYIDESNKDLKEKLGPSPAKLLALSILGCLTASFEFCLLKRDIYLSELEGKAEVTIARNEKNFWRVKKIDIKIIPKVDNPKMLKRIDQCKKFYEQYCIISESVREGIDLKVNLEY